MECTRYEIWNNWRILPSYFTIRLAVEQNRRNVVRDEREDNKAD